MALQIFLIGYKNVLKIFGEATAQTLSEARLFDRIDYKDEISKDYNLFNKREGVNFDLEKKDYKRSGWYFILFSNFEKFEVTNEAVSNL